MIFDKRDHCFSFIDVVSEDSSERNDVSVCIVIRICRTGFGASSTEVTFGRIDGDFSIFQCDGSFATGFHADTTLNTFIFLPCYFDTALDSYVVLFCF